MAREVEIDHLRANIEVPIGRPVKLADINAQLGREGLDLVLIVGHWDGAGTEISPTTLELMTPAEHDRRCSLAPGPDWRLSGHAAERAQVSIIELENGRGVKS